MSQESDPREAPECIHDDMEQYYLSGSPSSEAFAPGLGDLQPGEELESTPWRKRGGWIADLARRRGRAMPDVDRVPPDVEPEPAQPEPSADALPAVAIKGVQVLVVHPSLDVRKQVAAVLTDMGMVVTTCGQAEQAVLQVLHERPDAVLAEVGSPELDALSFCARLRDRVREIPVLLVAPPHGDVTEAKAREHGAADLVQRPIGPQQLGERIRQAVARARAGSAPSPSVIALPHAEPRADAQTRNEILRQELKIQSLFELSKNVVGCIELDELYQGFLLNAMGQLGLSSGVLVHVDAAHPERPLALVARGIAPREARQLLDFGEGLGAHLLRAPQPLLLEDDVFPTELRSQVAAARSVGFGLACPMVAKGMPVGIALFGNKVSGQPLTADDLVMLSAVCNFAGPALEGARLYSELQETYYSTVRAFVWSLEAKDPYTRGHSQRVADYARVLGEAMGMAKRDLDMLVFGAVLHDIGKIGVPERILNKPGPLTQAEWNVVREHPEMGARIVGNIDYLEPAVGSVLHHHERIDGRGYPYGLVGTDIELGARIVTVVDSFDAMTTDRPYRKAMETSKAIELLREAAGRQFDPQLVERFVDLLEKGAVKVGSDADPDAVPVQTPTRAG